MFRPSSILALVPFWFPKPGRSTMGERRIHFLHSLSLVQIPESLSTGIPVLQVAANGRTRSATLSVSDDKFTVSVTFPKQTTGFFSKATNDNRIIDIGEIDRIQRGQSTQKFEKAAKKLPMLERAVSSDGSTSVALDPERSFSIIFRGAHTLDLMAPSYDLRTKVCDALDRILRTYEQSKTRVANDVLLLRYAWLQFGHTSDSQVPASALAQIVALMNFKPKEFYESYEKFGKVTGLDKRQRRRGLSFEQSAAFLHYLRRNSWMVKPVTVIWNELFGEIMNNGKRRETVSERTFLDRFLKTKQGEDASILDVRRIFRRLHDMEISHNAFRVDLDRITLDQFEAYLLAEANDAMDPNKASDLDRPLSEYWINSSHNTYLMGDQYTSHSSVEMYSNALYRGCRCLELDIWDGGKIAGTPVPVVWHGHTMTTKILFVDIIKTIKVFLNFHPDTLPIILSFENHCSIPYQEVMAEQLVKILGESLYVPTEASLFGPLPSPLRLRGQVVIKGRRPDGTEAEAYDTDDDSDDDSRSNAHELENSDAAARRAKLVKHGVSPQLAKLTLFHGFKLKSFEESIRKPKHHMHSFSENKVRNTCRNKKTKVWIDFNQTHMSRTYPAGSRVDSSNYNPLLAWSTGCQMVSLNFQTQDAFLRLNDGRFRENGNCGYVLKPASLMMRFDSSEVAPEKLSIRVLSGSCLPKPKGSKGGDSIDPYVKVTVFDVSKIDKETITTYPTGVVASNGFCPIWMQDRFTFKIYDPSVAMVQFTVHDKTKDDFIASASIPYSQMRRGIRSVKLFDATNTRSGPLDFAALLVDIKKTEHAIAEI